MGRGWTPSSHTTVPPGWPQHPLQEGSPSSSLMPGTAGGLALELLLSTALFRRLLLGSSHRKLGRYLGGVLSILTSPPFPEAGSLTPPFRPRPLVPRPRRGRAGRGRVFSIPGRLLGGCPAGGGAAPGARAPTLLTAFCESPAFGTDMVKSDSDSSNMSEKRHPDHVATQRLPESFRGESLAQLPRARPWVPQPQLEPRGFREAGLPCNWVHFSEPRSSPSPLVSRAGR